MGVSSRACSAAAFGFIGIFLGPTLLAVGFTPIQEWISPFRTRPPEPGAVAGAGPDAPA